MTTSRFVLFCGISIVLGVVAGSLEGVSIKEIVICSAILLIVILVWSDEKRVKRTLMILLLILLGALRYQVNELSYNLDELRSFTNQEIVVIGQVKSSIISSNGFNKFIIQTSEIDGRPIQGRIQVTTEQSGLEFGDVVRVESKVKIPPDFPDFSYQEYLARRGIALTTFAIQVEKVERSRNLRVGIMRLIFSWRSALLESVAKILESPENAIASALVLGERSYLPDGLKERFSAAGLSHILVVSGYHLTLVAGVIRGGLKRFLPPRSLFMVLVIVIWGYVALAGLQVSAIRAATMSSVLLVTRIGKRRVSRERLLVLAVVILLVLKPALVHDLGFRLSIAATAGIILLEPIFRRLLRSCIGSRYWRELVSVSVAAYVSVLPIIILEFGTLSLWAPVANLIVIPVVPILMFLSFTISVLGLLATPVARVISFVGSPVFEYLEKIVEVISVLPGSALTIKTSSWWFILIWYGILGLLIFRSKQQTKRSLLQSRKLVGLLKVSTRNAI